MSDLRVRANQAHEMTVTAGIDGIAAYLQEALGQKLVAYMAGVGDSKGVGLWARGSQHPRAEAEARLRAAYQIYHLLLSGDSPHAVRAWFIGMNPQLDDDSPAQALHEGKLKEALAAARSFITGG